MFLLLFDRRDVNCLMHREGEKTGAESIGKTDDLNGKYLNREVEDSMKREGEAK